MELSVGGSGATLAGVQACRCRAGRLSSHKLGRNRATSGSNGDQKRNGAEAFDISSVVRATTVAIRGVIVEAVGWGLSCRQSL